MPPALITAISQSAEIINKWRIHRHQHLQALINPLTQMYGFHGSDQMTRVAELFDTTWAYELRFLQPPNVSDQEDYFPHSCPIYNPSNPKDLANRHREVQNLVKFRTGPITLGDPITYSMKKLKHKDDWNNLNLAQLYRHVRRKVGTCPMNNIYEVILYAMYHGQLLNMFPSIRNPCYGFTRITTPSINPGSTRTLEVMVRVHPYNAS